VLWKHQHITTPHDLLNFKFGAFVLFKTTALASLNGPIWNPSTNPFGRWCFQARKLNMKSYFWYFWNPFRGAYYLFNLILKRRETVEVVRKLEEVVRKLIEKEVDFCAVYCSLEWSHLHDTNTRVIIQSSPFPALPVENSSFLEVCQGR